MESLLLKLQADVAARKQPPSEVKPMLRTGALVVLAFAVAFELGARSAEISTGMLARMQARERQAAVSALDVTRAQLEDRTVRLQRLERAYALSSRYGIGADLAMDIHDIAIAEEVDPALAFELVRVESRFNPSAISPVGALGLTQLMPATARILSPGISRQQIFERETNLRLGFRFYKAMLKRYDGDVRLALLAYNRGPATVDRLLAAGIDPSNGYARAVMGRVAD